MSTDTDEVIEFTGPANGRWFFTQIPDWIALCPDLKDGAYRLYAILRSLVHEKQDDSIRVLTHDQIASLMVGKNGKPSTVSTVKALLRNLEDVGLIEHPDGSRMASPTGRGNPNAQLRYRLNDWPDKQRYAGWRNAYDKLKWYSKDWAETRTDVAGDDYAAWLAGEGKTSPTRDNEEGGEQKTSPQAKKKTRHRRSFSSQDSPTTSGNAPSNKSSEQASVTTSSSSVTAADTTPTAGAQEKKTKTTTPEQIIINKLNAPDAQPQGGPPTPDEAATIKRRVISQAAADGVRIRSIEGYLSGRDVVLLEQDLAAVRGTQTTVDGSAGGWSWEDQLRAERRARNGVKGGARAPVPDHTYWQSVTDEDLKNLL